MPIPKNRYMEYLKDILEITGVLFKFLGFLVIVTETLFLLFDRNHQLDIPVVSLFVVISLGYFFKFLANRIK